MSAVGGTTLSAGLADAQTQLAAAVGAPAGFGTDSVAQFASAYRASHGGPILTLLGFNPFALVATGAFHALYWTTVVIFLGIMTLLAMQQVLAGRATVRGRTPLAALAQVYFRLLTGVLLMGNLPLVYGALMTLNSVLSQGVQAMAGESLAAVLQTGSLGTLALAQARLSAIRDAAGRRAIALYPAGASRAEMVAIGTWYNAMALALNARLAPLALPGQLPLLDSASWDNAQRPDDQVVADVGRGVVQNFTQLVADLGALPSGSGGLNVGFPAGAGSGLGLLSDALASDDAAAAAALALPATPSSTGAFEAARQLYAKNVLTHTLGYLDTQLLPVLGASPSLAERARAWFAEGVEHAAAAATGTFLSAWRAGVDWLARSLGIVLTRLVAFFFTAATAAMIEVELFMIVLTVPFWLLPATEEAFYGVLRSLFALSCAVPAYQFIMLFVDASMSLVLKYLLFGPLATGATGVGAAAGGLAYTAAAALAAVGSGGEVVGLVTACYLVAYVFLAIYVACKTPKLVGAFLKGAGAAGQFLSTFATGLVAGAATAFATAAVAGGSTGWTSRGWGAASGAARPVRSAYTAQTSAPAPRAVLGPVAAQCVQPTPAPAGAPPAPLPRPAAPPRPENGDWRSAPAFGLRTFVACLAADTPGEGAALAFKALEAHRKQQEKNAEARHKAAQSSSKAAHAPRKPKA